MERVADRHIAHDPGEQAHAQEPLGLMIALASFFLGQQDELPVFVQGSPVLFGPVLFAFVLLIFWLIRARFTKAFQGPVGGYDGTLA